MQFDDATAARAHVQTVDVLSDDAVATDDTRRRLPIRLERLAGLRFSNSIDFRTHYEKLPRCKTVACADSFHAESYKWTVERRV